MIEKSGRLARGESFDEQAMTATQSSDFRQPSGGGANPRSRWELVTQSVEFIKEPKAKETGLLDHVGSVANSLP
jgi:hypothetical protein